MLVNCSRCESSFSCDTWRTYCPQCVEMFADNRVRAEQAQRPLPNVICSGKIIDPADCPKSAVEPVTGRVVCGLCGSDQLNSEYGFCCHGLGVFHRCWGCGTALNFIEDGDE